eukprot:UN18733
MTLAVPNKMSESKIVFSVCWPCFSSAFLSR